MALNNGFTFNGIRKDYMMTISKRRTYWAPISRQLLTVPGMAGAYLSETNTDVRVIEVNVEISADSADELRKQSEDLAAWLYTKEPVELVFDDEVDRIYYAVVDGTFNPEEIVSHGYGTITFICPDPYKYGAEKAVEFSNFGQFNVDGTIDTEPIITCEIKADTAFVAVSDGEKINLIGNPTEVTQQPYAREERKFWHECNTLVGWAGTTSIEGGTNKGTLKAGSYYFWTDDYGLDSGWHGPAMKTSINTTLQDFQVDTLITQNGSSGRVGSIEIDMLDVNNQIIAKIIMTKRAPGSQANWARLRAGNDAGGVNILEYRGDADWVWANFDGIMRIGRVGRSWYAYVATIRNGKHDNTLYKTWEDTQGLYTAKVSQIQVQLWQYGTVPATDQRINDLKVYKINSPVDNQIPYVARAGDVIEFDHINDIIRKNGEPILKEKAFVGEYFPLSAGSNNLLIEPSESINSTEVRWRPKWR
ncbi:distal tail protein Dit [Neobacillus sp. 19]|uniref:distal tail protein Dit n=1 Tax=Neobacillus sp. 19 TaxID=3394458 RepID=UPI003BF74F8A